MDYQAYVQNAIGWAKQQLESSDYCFLCLAFVEDAYEKSNGIEIFGGSTATESAELYAVLRGAGVPPPGAFVFYDWTGTIHGVTKNWGHVGLSCGDGKIIHAWGKVREDDYLAVEQLEAPPGGTSPRYIGWVGVERILQGHRGGNPPPAL